MKAVPAFALGTYYKVRSPAAGPNASPMRGLVYLVKANQDPKPNWLHHPDHPCSDSVSLDSAAAAHNYVADIIASKLPELRKAFGFGADEISLVPIPSSGITQANWKENWGPRSLALALQHRGVGKVVTALVNARAVPASHSGQKPPAPDIGKNYLVQKQILPDAPVLFVDDIITWGNHIAAADAVIQAVRSAAVATAFTDGTAGLDCYQARHRIVRYDMTVAGWDVSISNT